MRRAAAALLALVLASCGSPADGPFPRNILLIVVDTLRADHLSPYGASLHTPTAAALAARGQVFPNVWSSFHQTSMSMGAMMTGRTPSIETGDPTETLPWNSSTWCGMARFARPGDRCLPDSLPTLAERLAEAGWHTVGVVSNQFLYEPSGFGRGYADWTEVDERKPVTGPASRVGIADPAHSRDWRRVNAAALAALDRAPEGGRTFLYVHYIDVHDYALLGRSYAEGVELTDAAIGHLLDALEARGFLASSVVLLTSDHGERLGEDHRFPGELPNNRGHYGNPSFEEVLRVPLIVAPPVLEDPSRMLRTQDLWGLVQEIAGLDPGPPRDTAPDELFVGEMQYRTYRKGEFKATLRREDGHAHLWNLVADPEEQQDVASEKPLRVLAHRERANELSRALAGETPGGEGLSEDDRARLSALGYLEQHEAADGGG